ncbi:MAG TPA: Xaa-Pro peptidase family protein [Bryobacteraceae bacterium]|nr:Xaa-Pro peptidase family protein [Bryobacteraceae bacterium]
MKPELKERIRQVSERLLSEAFLVTHLPNVRYLTGFTGSNAALVLDGRNATLLTDPRYNVQAMQESACKVKIVKGNLIAAAAKLIAARQFKSVGFEQDHMLFSSWSSLRGAAGRKVRLQPVSGLVETARMIKSPAEIELIRRSAEANSAACARAMRRLKPTTTEAELAAEIDHGMRRAGAEGPAFESIVAAGEHSALPHARPRNEAIGSNRLLLMDTGAVRGGYCSDMTRMACLGTPDRRSRDLFNAVLEAQLAALDAVKAGVATVAVDATARKVLRKHGCDKLFVHSTGHGLGLEIHEGPRVGRKDPTVLEAGMAITIEPGAYIEGFGGVRIEDTVVVTASGCEVLTPHPKELLTI